MEVAVAICSERFPWSGMLLTYNGNVTIGCCVYKGEPDRWDVDNPPELQELWNSKKICSERRFFKENNFLNSGCKGCQCIVMDVNDERVINSFSKVATESQKNNWDLIVESSNNGLENIENAPSKLELCFTSKCNIKCVMCFLEYMKYDGGRKELSSDMLLSNRSFLSKIDTFLVTGGEPLISKEAIKFIEGMVQDEELRNSELHLVTNGLLLHKVMHLLEKLPRVRLSVSIDGVGEAYEKIRVGGKWSQLATNIDAFLDRKESLAKDWKFDASCVLLKTSVEHLESLVDWIIEKNIDISFLDLRPTRYTFNEDLIGNCIARDSIDWRGILDRSIERLNEVGKGTIADRLKKYSNELEKITGDNDLHRGVNDWQSFLDSDEIKGKKVMIWGTSGNFKQYYSEWLKKREKDIKFLGFIDNNESCQGKILQGYKIFSPHESVGLFPDIIFLAVTMIWRGAIREQIAAIGFKDDLIVV